MIKKLALLLVLLVALGAASSARSQQPVDRASDPVKRVHSADSVDLKISPELKKSLDDLAASVQALARRIASDPKIRSDAIKVASGLVATAQHVVTEQSVVLQEALKTAADRISATPPTPRTPEKPIR
ncbi:MAG: hypothetical protein ACR2NS_07965 [Gemmatimonadaceae bacterium]